MNESPFSLGQTLKVCQNTAGDADSIQHSPLRCMVRRGDDAVYDVLPFIGQEYLAISYSWPADGWTRLYDSNKPAHVMHPTDKYPRDCAHFSLFARKAVEDPDIKRGCGVWLDHECIDQSNDDEKGQQVAVMDKIYNKAAVTIILLEDVELRTDDYDLLQTSLFSRVKTHFDEYAELVRRILRARWFSRAWCSQELVLSRWPVLFVHRSDDPAGRPIQFSLATLKHWMERATIRDPTIRDHRLSDPRGFNPNVTRGTHFCNAIAWAFGVVYSMGCYNLYDKIALVSNLIQADVSARILKLPKADGSTSPVVSENVVKVVNVWAILQGDFSLLLTSHVVQNPLQGVEGFGWGGPCLRGDIVSESWHPNRYNVEKENSNTTVLDDKGIVFKGIVAEVLQQVDWKFCRNSDGLHITVDGEDHLITSDWLSDAYPTSRPLQPDQALFRDLSYLIEAFNEVDIYRLIFDPLNDEWAYDDGLGNLKTHFQSHFGAYSTTIIFFASRLAFLRAEGLCGFSILSLVGGLRLLVRGNVSDLRGKALFQPHVIRPREFGKILPTVNSLVLQPIDQTGNDSTRTHRCLGGVRGFGLIPEDFGEIVACAF